MVLDRDDILRKHARRVEKFDDRLGTLLDDMAETMAAGNGVGLAAPQVGVLKRCVVIDAGEIARGDDESAEAGETARGGDESAEAGETAPNILELVNPEIVASEGEVTVIEGCLSVPDRAGRVVRPEKVTVRAQDRHGNAIEVTGEGMLAVCLCHELDHLDGVLYVDKMIEDATEEVKRRKGGEGQ